MNGFLTSGLDAARDTNSPAGFGEFYEGLELDFKLFFFVDSVSAYIGLKNPSDATLASLSILIYSRWRPRWRPIIS